MHNTLCVLQVRCIAPLAWSSLYGLVLTSSEQFFRENFWEMMQSVDLDPLGYGTTLLVTYEPLFYGHV